MINKKLIYRGKGKDVLLREDDKYEFLFRDGATGYYDSNGKPVFDPGYDKVIGAIAGKGKVSCQLTKYFFELMKDSIATHYICTEGPDRMVVEPVELISRKKSCEIEGAENIYNLEWVFRNNATGSFWRRYPCVRPPAHPPSFKGEPLDIKLKGNSEDIAKAVYEALGEFRVSVACLFSRDNKPYIINLNE